MARHRRSSGPTLDCLVPLLVTLLALLATASGLECEAGMTSEECCDARTHRCSLLYEAAHEHVANSRMHQKTQQNHQHSSQHKPASSSRIQRKRSKDKLHSHVATGNVSPQSRVADDKQEQASNDIACMPYRTYLLCLRNFTCVGNIHYHVAMRGVERKMAHDGCPLEGPVYHSRSGGQHSHEWDAQLSPECVYKRVDMSRTPHRYGYCALYGDPHLRTVDGRHHTCGMHGAWPLLDNRHITVQVTSDRMTDDGDVRQASAVTKVTVLLKRNDECADSRYVTYEASSDWLPSVFTDGRAQVQSVSVVELEPNARVEVRVPYIDTTITVRQVGGYLSVAIRIPLDIANITASSSSSGTSMTSSNDVDEEPTETLQLCLSGCPSSQIIGHLVSSKHVRLKSPDVTSDVGSGEGAERLQRVTSATEACRRAGLVDAFLDSCVFDVIATGNEAFVNASAFAMADMLNALPSIRHHLTNRTSPSLTWHRHVTETPTTLRPPHGVNRMTSGASSLYVMVIRTQWVCSYACVILAHFVVGLFCNCKSCLFR